MMQKTKTVTMAVQIAIVTIGAVGIGIGTTAQSAQGMRGWGDEPGPGQSELHDGNGDLTSGLNSNGHSHA
jgi:hypothetical protein